MATRTTDCELGTIHHREETLLLPARRCQRGHIALAYVDNRGCVACGKLNVYRWRYGARGPSRRYRGRRFTDYAAARAHHENIGGFLLIVPGGYLVTDSYNYVRTLRSVAWIRRCDEVACWDEVEMSTATDS